MKAIRIGLGFLAALYAIQAYAARPTSIETIIEKAAEKNGISPSLLKSICRVESNFNASAVGDDGRSIGLCQIQVNTALLHYKWWHKDKPEEERRRLIRSSLLDPRFNANLAAQLMRKYLEEFNDEMLAIMAYNGGPSAAVIKYYQKVKSFKVKYYTASVQ